MRWVLVMLCFLGLTASFADAKKVKTPKSANARALGKTHKSNYKHEGQKIKVRKKREKLN